MSFRSRLIVAFSVPIVLLLANVVVVAIQQHAVHEVSTAVLAREAAYGGVSLVEDLRRDLAGPLDADRSAVRTVYWGELIKRVEETLSLGDGLMPTNELNAALAAASNTAEAAWEDFLSEPSESSVLFLDVSLVDLAERLSIVSTGLRRALIDAVEHERSIGRLPLRFGLGMSFLAAVLALGYSIWFARRMTRPIELLAAASSKIADGDLSVHFERTGLSEFDILTSSLETMGSRLEEMLVQISDGRSAVTDAARTIHKSIDQAAAEEDRQAEAVKETTAAVDTIGETIRNVAVDAGGLHVAAQASSDSVGQLEENTAIIADDTKRLQDEARLAMSALTQLESTMKSVAETGEILDDAANATSASTDRIRSALEGVESDAAKNTLLALESSDGAESGSERMRSAREGMSAIESAFQRIGSTVEALDKRSESIDEVVSVIGGIADQTKLLALNASIIAAQAGEQEHGFGVVARELSVLASRSLQSVDEVSVLVSEVRDQIRASVDAADAGSASVSLGTRLVDQAKDQLGQIAERVVKSQRQSASISDAVARSFLELKVVENEALRTSDVASEIRSTTAEQHEATRVIQACAARVAGLSLKVRELVQAQREQSAMITNAAGEVTTRSQQIRNMTAEQQARADQIECAIEVFDGVAVDRVATIGGLRIAAGQLLEKSKLLERHTSMFTVHDSND